MIGRQFTQRHGAAGVNFIGGNANFGTEAKFLTVGESRGDIVKHTGAVDVREKGLCGVIVLSDNAIGVMRAVVIDVGDRFVERGDHFDR